jgi:transposase-like protein DUF772/DDE family transposase
MLGKRGRQRGLFEADTLYSDFVGRDTFYGWLASQRGTLFRDEDFAQLYVLTNGRPSVPPSLLATALVLQTYDGVSDDEARQRAAYDLRWKVALGVAVDARPFAKSTLQEFRAQLIVHQEQAAIFQQSLAVAKRQGQFRTPQGDARQLKVALDTTNILGRGAVKDTYNLLADGMRHVLRVLARQAGEALESWATAAGYGRYVNDPSVKGGAGIDWADPTARDRFLGTLVADADRLLDQVRRARAALAAGGPEDTALVEAAGLLSRVLQQDVERPTSGPTLKQGTAPDRLVSIHDPEMRHGRKSARKRFDGHKAAVAVDTDSQLITAVAVQAGNAPDAAQALSLVEQSEQATGCAVGATYGDCAYGDGATRQAFADAGRVLIATVPARTNQGRFPKTAFQLDLRAGTCTCPGEQTTAELRRTAGGQQGFVFAAAVCGPCPLRAQCVAGAGSVTPSGAGVPGEPRVRGGAAAPPDGRASARAPGPVGTAASPLHGADQDALSTADGCGGRQSHLAGPSARRQLGPARTRGGGGGRRAAVSHPAGALGPPWRARAPARDDRLGLSTGHMYSPQIRGFSAGLLVRFALKGNGRAHSHNGDTRLAHPRS